MVSSNSAKLQLELIQALQAKESKSKFTKKAALIKSSFKVVKDPQAMRSLLAKFLKKLSALAQYKKTTKTTDAPPVVTGFDNLPAEIRNQIWELAMEDELNDRFVVIDASLCRIIPFPLTAVSPLLSVNRETRALALQALPQSIGMRRIRQWRALRWNGTGTHRIPVTEEVDCGVLRYNIARDKVICGMRYALLGEKEKLDACEGVQVTEDAILARSLSRGDEAGAVLRRVLDKNLAGMIPLWMRFTSAKLPEHNTFDFPQVQNLVGLQPFVGPWFEISRHGREEQRRVEQHRLLAYENRAPRGHNDNDNDNDNDSDSIRGLGFDGDHPYDDVDDADLPFQEGEDTIAPWLSEEYRTRRYFPTYNRHVNRLFPGRCTCSREFDEDGFGYCYCNCVHVPIPLEQLDLWLEGMGREGMPWFRDFHRQLVLEKM